MRILCNDIGTGTQDIFLYDSRLDVENGYKLILPSPTMMVHRKLKQAAERRQSVAIHGLMMGGGPSSWGVDAVLKVGARVYTTPEAARTLNDDLDEVREMGVTLVSSDEIRSLPTDVLRIEMRDFDYVSIRDTFSRFGVPLDNLDAVAVAVFDHGDAPPDISDRKFRFDYLDQRIRFKNSLSTFAYRRDQIPSSMTRLQSVEKSAVNIPGELIVMDTAPAAIAGALLDRKVASLASVMIANVGNFHTLAFRMNKGKIDGVFEHHTGLLTPAKLDNYLQELMDGTLDRESVFADQGHGSLIYDPVPMKNENSDFDLAVTGPRRGFMRASRFRSYFPAPFGDMMISGCFGLLTAVADMLPEHQDEIMGSLRNSGSTQTAPWDIIA